MRQSTGFNTSEISIRRATTTSAWLGSLIAVLVSCLAVTEAKAQTPVDLDIPTMSVAPTQASAGSDVTYSITVRSSAATTGVIVTTVLAPGLSFVSGTPSCSDNRGTVTCSVGSMPGTSSVSVVARTSVAGAIKTVSGVIGNDYDANMGNNSFRVDSNVTASTTPTVTSVSPNVGSVVGGQTVTITGTNFTGATAVKFDATNATSFNVVSATQINAVTPPLFFGHALPVAVSVTTPSGTGSTANAFTYYRTPSITSLSPTSGSTAGGTSVLINGDNLNGATIVSFGGTNASFVINSNTRITATAPAHAAGAVNVVITNPALTGTLTGGYTYVVPLPTVTSVSPNGGPVAGGQTVTIIGTNLTAATVVKFGSVNATSFSFVSATQISAVTPAFGGAHATAVSVSVTTPAGTGSKANAYTYYKAPTITSIAPGSGPVTGGNSVTIDGNNFTGTTSVTFGGTNATITSITNTRIVATSPARPNANAAALVVSNPGGSAQTTFLYDDAAFVSQSPPPASMIAAQPFTVSITMRNTGSSTWTAAQLYSLGSQNPQDNTIWRTSNRVILTSSVAPLGTHTFSFAITAPLTPGTYNFRWRMVRDGVAWFGALTTNVVVAVSEGVDGATFVSQSPPPVAAVAGQTYPVSITMRNSGTSYWTATLNHRLGTQNPPNNTNFGTGRMYLPAGLTVAPGTEYTFSTTITAPSVSGVYNFQWQMLRENVRWFGPLTPNVAVTVASPALKFYTLAPCRVLDTRSTTPLAAGAPRVLQITGGCGIPASAKAIAATFVALDQAADGFIRLYPTGTVEPLTSSINFRGSLIRSNNGMLSLSSSGQITAVSSTNSNLILDVTGYFQ